MQLSARIVALLNLIEGDYDYVVLDTPPQASALVTSALASADEIIVPVATGRGALDGLTDVIELTERMGLPRVTGAFATRVNKSSIHDRELAEYVAQKILSDAGEPVIKTFVRETVRVREAEMARMPLALYARDSTAGQDYSAVLDEIDHAAAAS
jgi:chromosome partitioning protein